MGKVKNQGIGNKTKGSSKQKSKKSIALSFQKKIKKAKPVITNLKKLNLKNKDIVETLDKKLQDIQSSTSALVKNDKKIRHNQQIPLHEAVDLNDTVSQMKTMNF